MRSLFENKRLVLLLAVLALGALTILALSLNQVPFREAQHFGREEAEEVQLSAEQVSLIWAEVPIWKQVLLWTLLALMIVLVGLLLSPEMRKRMFIMIARVVFTAWVIYFLSKNYAHLFAGFGFGGEAVDQSGGGAAGPIPVFEPPQVSPTFTYLISFGFALLWLAVLWGLYRGWKKYRLRHAEQPLDEIAKIARSSLDDLASGRNSSDVIINCYLRMSDVVSSRRQLHRDIAMTPHEFALRLERAGLPGDAVNRLTRLFEAVRYGDRKSAPKDITEAVNCLKTILHYCGEPI